MYIQYFCTKLFSGTGFIGSPSGVSGGGTRSSGLETGKLSRMRRRTLENAYTEAASVVT